MLAEYRRSSAYDMLAEYRGSHTTRDVSTALVTRLSEPPSPCAVSDVLVQYRRSRSISCPSTASQYRISGHSSQHMQCHTLAQYRSLSYSSTGHCVASAEADSSIRYVSTGIA
eukprot:1668944-Rhodomonas_salina.1